MKIIIAGTGAMGATYGSKLIKNGNEVVFLDLWEENVNQINKNGILLNDLGKMYKIYGKVFYPEDYKEVPDLIIVFTKSMFLKDMLEKIKHLLGDKTKVLCLLNGLGHIDTLKKFVKEENIIMGITVLTAGMNNPGEFSIYGYGKTEIQNIHPLGEKDAKKITDIISESGLPTIYSEDILYSIWRKACINGTLNPCCTLLDCNIETLGKIKKSKKLLGTIVEEFVAVAKREGVNIELEEMKNLVYRFTTPEFDGYLHYPSMHQDLIQKNKKTEIDYLNGYVSKKGKEYGINTKFCDLITMLIHGKEEILI